MRAVKILFLLLGAGLLGVLVYRVGAEPILEALGRLTWWQFVLVCLPYGVSAAADTLGWRSTKSLDDIISSSWTWHSTHPRGYE